MNKRQVPAHLKQVSSRKGKKQTPAQLSARKSRVELTLKQKCEIIDEAKKRGFKPETIGTLNRVNQTQLAEKNWCNQENNQQGALESKRPETEVSLLTC